MTKEESDWPRARIIAYLERRQSVIWEVLEADIIPFPESGEWQTEFSDCLAELAAGGLITITPVICGDEGTCRYSLNPLYRLAAL